MLHITNLCLLHLLDRNKQFAVVENPGFWNWTFTLKDDHENVLAEINRDWRGIGLEVQYLSFSNGLKSK